MWRLHRAGQRHAHQLLSRPRHHEGRRGDHHHRGARPGGPAASHATGVHRSGRAPVRLLHAGADLLSPGADPRGAGDHSGGGSRADERQYLSVRRVRADRGRHPPGHGVEKGGRREVNPFAYTRVTEVAEAVEAISSDASARFVAGGTNLLDLMKERVEQPSRLVDITHLPLGEIEVTASGGLRMGALATNTDVAYHPVVERRYPLLSKAILAGASAQLRNMASVGGNLLQRTRCMYFYDWAAPCNKRAPGTGCSAIEGVNCAHAILGTSEHCIATHPSDMCVALAALDALVLVTGPRGERSIPFGDFHRLPGNAPEIDTALGREELILAVELPSDGFAAHHAYVKIRERASYAFALVSVAVALRLEEGSNAEARIALGGVAHKPWRDRQVEALLHGRPATQESYRTAAESMLHDARGFGHNDFKIELAKRAIVRALAQAAGAEVSR